MSFAATAPRISTLLATAAAHGWTVFTLQDYVQLKAKGVITMPEDEKAASTTTTKVRALNCSDRGLTEPPVL
jgi:hypothetical protein